VDAIAAIVGAPRKHFQASGVSAKNTEYVAHAFLAQCFLPEKPVSNRKSSLWQ